MKRNESLYQLSHDHHHGLVKANQLTNLNKNLADKDALRNATIEFIRFYKDDLMNHFREEEEILLPVFAKFTSKEQPFILETLKQHVEIRQRLIDLEEDINNVEEINVEALIELGNILKSHIRFEERQLFPAVEQFVPEHYLLFIKEKINKSQK